MSKISDELRKKAKRVRNSRVSTYRSPSEYERLADRIDQEMVELPRDRDGVPIHVGDVLTDGEYTFRVDELAAFGDGSWSIRNEDGNAWAACDVTHHHAPTVEDVLREFTDEVWNRCCEGATASDSGIDELVAEYAAKLRLAGEDE